MVATASSNRLRSIALAIFLLPIAVTAGCEQKLDPQEYGQVITTLPKIKGAEQRYPLPELDDSQENAIEDTK